MSLFKKIKGQFAANQFQREMLRGTSLGVLMKIFGLGVAYLFALIVARNLGADAWGEFSLALSLMIVGARIGTFGLDMGLLKLSSGSGEIAYISSIYKRSLMICICISLVITILIYYSADWFASTLFSKPDLLTTFRLSSVAILPFSIINLNSRTLQGIDQVQKFIFLRFVSRHIFSLMILLVLILFSTESIIVIVSFILSLIIIAFLSTYWVFKSILRNAESKKIRSSEYKNLYSLSISLLFTALFVLMINWVDTVMVGIFLPEKSVGIYNITLKLSTLLVIVLGTISEITAPKISESYSDANSQDLQKIVSYSTNLIFYLTLPVFIVLIAFPEFMLGIFGEDFKSGKNALIILSVGHLLNAFSGTVSYFMQMTGSQVAFQIIMFSTLIICVILNYLLIPLYGIEGAAVGTGIGLVYWNSICVIFIKYKYGIKTYVRPFFKFHDH